MDLSAFVFNFADRLSHHQVWICWRLYESLLPPEIHNTARLMLCPRWDSLLHTFYINSSNSTGLMYLLLLIIRSGTSRIKNISWFDGLGKIYSADIYSCWLCHFGCNWIGVTPPVIPFKTHIFGLHVRYLSVLSRKYCVFTQLPAFDNLHSADLLH